MILVLACLCINVQSVAELAESEKKRILEAKKQSGELEKLLRNPFL